MRDNLTCDVSLSRTNVKRENPASSGKQRLSVLLVPDWSYWILGTIARGIARANPWMDATIVSGPILDELLEDDPAFFSRFDLVHFICPYASKRWLEPLSERLPVVTSHHHVTEWNAVSHNLDGDAIIAGSEQWVDDIVQRGADRQRVVSVPYGVDSNLFVPPAPAERTSMRSSLGLGSGPVIGFFAKRGSNDDDRKGIDVFSRAVKALHELQNDAAVLIVGPGWGEMVEEFRDAGITCVWIPFLENLSDVARLYHALDFYWVTARVEGGPVPLLEAMSCGVCALTTRVGLARELVVDRVNAVFIEMNSPEAFAGETVRLWRDTAGMAAMAAAARSSIVSNMHVDNTLKGVRTAYNLAFERFAQRTGGTLRRIEPVPDESIADSDLDDNDALHALSRSEKKRVRALEALSWSEHLLIYQGQRRAAFRLILTAWLLQPLSAEPARTLLRRFLPVPVVRRLIALKHELFSRAV